VAIAGKEVEIKLRASSPEEAAARLHAAGFVLIRPRLFETNLLLDAGAGVLRSRGEALRVRECGGETILTYKGPSTVERHKSREEIETHADSAAALLSILSRLGFEPTYRYEKFRTEFARPGEPGIATVDETPIGVFMELEGDPDWIDRAADILGFSKTDFIIDSYAALFRRYCDEQSIALGAGMIYGDDLRTELGISGLSNRKRT
jgi:adenylate cyclase, class 2